MNDKPSILLVDDQAQNFELLEAFLAPQGYEVLVAGSGEETLEKLSANPIDKMELLARIRFLLKVKAYNDPLGKYRDESELEVARRIEDLKPAQLDPPEWEIMKRHRVIGAKILKGSKAEYIGISGTIALCRHERGDDSGYPKGLKGKHFDSGMVGASYAIKDEILAIRESCGDEARPGADSRRGAPNVR
jgi:CheY-like chemotaxis protein